MQFVNFLQPRARSLHSLFLCYDTGGALPFSLFFASLRILHDALVHQHNTFLQPASLACNGYDSIPTLYTFAHTFVALFSALFSHARSMMPLLIHSSALAVVFFSARWSHWLTRLMVVMLLLQEDDWWDVGVPECRGRSFLYLFLFGYSRRSGLGRISVTRAIFMMTGKTLGSLPWWTTTWNFPNISLQHCTTSTTEQKIFFIERLQSSVIISHFLYHIADRCSHIIKKRHMLHLFVITSEIGH